MLPSRHPVSLQISLTPADLPDVRLVLPHQLRAWGAQVDEILCVVDAPPAQARHYPARLEAVSDFLEGQRRSYPSLAWRLVDYSAEAFERVAQVFYRGHAVPAHDYRHRPIYSYLYSLLAATHDLVLHLDCDMMFGGGSQTWVAEAVERMTQRPDVVAGKPYPGPPRADGRPLSQRRPPVKESETPFAYRFSSFTCRVFLVDRRVFVERLAPLRDEWPPWQTALRALLRRRRPHATLEQVIGTAMRRHGQWRMDMLGHGAGMWTLHPHYRTARYRSVLPELIRMVEAGRVPEAQRGHYDLTDAMLRGAEEAGPAATAG
ncbi:MAG TPA: hypothetical protein VJQ46_09485 [Gemmatimonadales bacterium]|nr:hypothetical protein [Gemmatimonadales bacterium]